MLLTAAAATSTTAGRLCCHEALAHKLLQPLVWHVYKLLLPLLLALLLLLLVLQPVSKFGRQAGSQRPQRRCGATGSAALEACICALRVTCSICEQDQRLSQ